MEPLVIDALLRDVPLHHTGIVSSHLHDVFVSDDPAMPVSIDRHCLRIALTGQLELQNGAYVAVINPDSYYLTNPGRNVRCIGFDDSDCLWMMVGFAPDSVRNLQHRKGQESFFYELRSPVDEQIASQARKLAFLTTETGLAAADTQATAEQLLLLILRAQNRRRPEIDKVPARSQKRREDLYIRLSRARDFLDARYMDDPHIEHLADVAHLSRSHFLRMYRAAFDSTPHQDLLERKLEAACELLKGSRYSVTEVADACGFGNRCAFSRLFGQRLGMSPRAYRKQMQARSQV